MNPDERHALGRAVQGLAVGVAREVAGRRARSEDGLLAERDEQWQVAISGVAAEAPVAVLLDIDFAQDFSTAAGNRMSQLARPHFHYGFEVSAASDGVGNPSAVPPILSAAVTRWTLDGLHITGATVAITAHSPGGPLTFRGAAHLTFQGYGVVSDSQPDQED